MQKCHFFMNVSEAHALFREEHPEDQLENQSLQV